jgi:hypothetical protein
VGIFAKGLGFDGRQRALHSCLLSELSLIGANMGRQCKEQGNGFQLLPYGQAFGTVKASRYIVRPSKLSLY